jgi:hypothetical protein
MRRKCGAVGPRAPRRAQRQQPVPVDHLEARAEPRQLASRRGEHARQEELGELVGHDEAGAPGERLEQPAPRARAGST